MPELPEVQTVVSTLQTQINKSIIRDVIVKTSSIVQQDPEMFRHYLLNKQFIQFNRRGKYIVLKLNEGYLVVHLRMEGRFFIRENIEDNKHVHVVFVLSNNKVLHYQDTRKFGKMKYLKDDNQLQSYLSHLGVEFEDESFNGNYLYNIAKTSKRSLKALLLSQHVVAGIGNIYADEICFYAKLHPATQCDAISLKKWNEIATGVSIILAKATKLGGSSIRSYTDSLGISGRFQLELQVHMRKDKACNVCSTPIVKTKVANRGTYVCLTCQKLKK